MTRREFLEFLALSGFGLVLAGKSTASAVGRGPAKKWAMVVDLDRCAKDDGCVDCIAACHRVHNVPNISDPRHQVKWIWTTPFGRLFPEQGRYGERQIREQKVLTLCNHCENPPCVAVCPTKATFRRDDGIVMMDYHRCIGCRYCMAACPYGARSFNWVDPRPYIQTIDKGYPTRTRGVVEKCNFCEERLAKGLAPACVESCREKALAFGDLNDPDSAVSRSLRSHFALQRKAELGTAPKVFYLPA